MRPQDGGRGTSTEAVSQPREYRQVQPPRPDVNERVDAVHDAGASARARADDARRRAAVGEARADESRRRAAVVEARADDARRRATAAREAADRATTEYARTSHLRVADLHAELAVLQAHDAGALGLASDEQGPD